MNKNQQVKVSRSIIGHAKQLVSLEMFHISKNYRNIVNNTGQIFNLNLIWVIEKIDKTKCQQT